MFAFKRVASFGMYMHAQVCITAEGQSGKLGLPDTMDEALPVTLIGGFP